mmetsp:Transcript_32449/g.55508  ORF Transcript_32449/g.55508 Transcript_32449/m.55508 type:complete len:807 (+) Transcript_32449:34-2454(+)
MKPLFLLFILFGLVYSQPPASFGIGGIFERSLTDTDTGELYRPPDDILATETGFRLAIEDINSSTDLLPSTQLTPVVFDSEGTVAGALAGLVAADELGVQVVVGPSFSDQSLISAVASGIYDILLASPSSSSASLSDDSLYPLFIRGVAPDTFQANVIVDLVDEYYNRTQVPNWREIGIICTADDYGVSGSRNVISLGESRGIFTIAFQQFLVGAEDVEVEVRELATSGARVFISYMLGSDYQTMIREADNQDIIGDFYVWICSDGCATPDSFEDYETGRVEEGYMELSLGLQGVLPQGGVGDLYDDFLERWKSLDPNEYIGAGPGTEPPLFALIAYEMAVASANAIHLEFLRGNFNPNGTELYRTALSITFPTLTGDFILESNGDRDSAYEVVNFYPNGEFVKIFSWDDEDGLSQVAPIAWHDGTTNIPDLGVLPEFDYWSCDDKESGTDVTGKTINLEKPDGDDINFIDGDYECDQYIDCQNMSDEGYQCTPSFTVAFVVVGILTGILILGTIWLLPLVCVFGFCVRRHRFFLSGSLFLIILVLTCILGFISTYAWYGKPHTVACNFQLWLFGIASTFLACALFAKQFRFWRATAATNFYRKITKSDEKGVSTPIPAEIEFFIYFLILVCFPLLIMLLWTIIATPTAELEEHDDLDHYLCTSGGFTGEPVGLVFFFILVGYCGVLLFGSLFISFLVRHVPQPFMDKRLVFLSVFNLTFASAVVIPVYFVLIGISPFAAWIVRTFGILYGFGSTLAVHMVPKCVGLLLDKFQPNAGDGPGKGPTMRGGAGSADPNLSMSQSASVG